MAISAADVKTLREQTGVGMMECKKALEEADGDFAAATDILRRKLKGKMDERTDRSAAEGAIAVAVADGAATMVEVNTETDFTAKNEMFIDSVKKIAQIALDQAAGDVAANDQITELIDNIRITTKENASYRRGVKVEAEKVGSYVHHNNKLGVVVTATGPIDDGLLTGICQHITAHVPPPVAVDEAGLPDDQRQKALGDAKQEAIDSGKPEQIAEKIAAGKYGKWVGEHTLLGQQYVKDMEGKSTVAENLPDGATITGFVRYVVGV
jgi:elongation factor Ts